jgi:hypothetical protein
MVGDNVFAKLQSVLHQNEGYSTICKISDILSGKQATFVEDTQNLVAMIAHFSNMPQLLPVMWKGVFPVTKRCSATIRDHFCLKTSQCV